MLTSVCVNVSASSSRTRANSTVSKSVPSTRFEAPTAICSVHNWTPCWAVSVIVSDPTALSQSFVPATRAARVVGTVSACATASRVSRAATAFSNGLTNVPRLTTSSTPAASP